jgi:hypothetical protein
MAFNINKYNQLLSASGSMASRILIHKISGKSSNIPLCELEGHEVSILYNY